MTPSTNHLLSSVLLCTLLQIASGQVFPATCPYGNVPTSADRQQISVFRSTSTSYGDPKYRIFDSTAAPSQYVRNDGDTASTLRANPNSGQCPINCLARLDAYRAPGDLSILHEKTSMNPYAPATGFIPAGYTRLDDARPIYCTPVLNQCGATVPVFRHFRVTPQGIEHAYSFRDTTVFPNFVKEAVPLCYVWSTVPAAAAAPKTAVKTTPKPPTKPSVARAAAAPVAGSCAGPPPARAPAQAPAASSCTNKTVVSPAELTPLRIYFNNFLGAPHTRRNHFTTTLPANNTQLKGYVLSGTLGAVAKTKTTACNCLVKVTQLVDDQNGMFARLDHKLILDGKEPNRPFETYKPTGETFFCSPQANVCGATLPLYKNFDIVYIDSQYTSSPAALPNSVHAGPSANPSKPICYIWSSSAAVPAAKLLNTTKKPLAG